MNINSYLVKHYYIFASLEQVAKNRSDQQVTIKSSV